MGQETRRWTLLKADLLGRVERGHSNGEGDLDRVRRDTAAAAAPLRPLARALARREARALGALAGLEGTPALLSWDGRTLERGWLEGAPLQTARTADPAFHAAARRLLGRLHRRGVTHNDLAKEPNLLVREDGRPALVDYQLAKVHRRRGRWFHHCAREDLRHLLKHKRTYCPEALTEREKSILASPGWTSRVWRRTGKPVYLFVTRRLLGWADREGAGDRGAPTSRP